MTFSQFILEGIAPKKKSSIYSINEGIEDKVEEIVNVIGVLEQGLKDGAFESSHKKQVQKMLMILYSVVGSEDEDAIERAYAILMKAADKSARALKQELSESGIPFNESFLNEAIIPPHVVIATAANGARAARSGVQWTTGSVIFAGIFLTVALGALIAINVWHDWPEMKEKWGPRVAALKKKFNVKSAISSAFNKVKKLFGRG